MSKSASLVRHNRTSRLRMLRILFELEDMAGALGLAVGTLVLIAIGVGMYSEAVARLEVTLVAFATPVVLAFATLRWAWLERGLLPRLAIIVGTASALMAGGALWLTMFPVASLDEAVARWLWPTAATLFALALALHLWASRRGFHSWLLVGVGVNLTLALRAQSAFNSHDVVTSLLGILVVALLFGGGAALAATFVIARGHERGA